MATTGKASWSVLPPFHGPAIQEQPYDGSDDDDSLFLNLPWSEFGNVPQTTLSPFPFFWMSHPTTVWSSVQAPLR